MLDGTIIALQLFQESKKEAKTVANIQAFKVIPT
jgi:hypothetical protein